VDRDDVQPLPLEIVHHRIECDAPPAPAAAAARRRAWSMSTSRMAHAAEANSKFRSAALSKTDSPSKQITASWTTAVGESVWSARSRRINREATWRSSS
jgi:hypothetical protein